MTVHVCVSGFDGRWDSNEIWHFETVEEAIAQAREEAQGFEDSGFWWSEGSRDYRRFDSGDYPEVRDISVYDDSGEYYTWRVEE